MRGVAEKFRYAAIVVGLLCAAPPLAAQSATQNVLVLQSYDRGNQTLDYFTGNFLVDLDQRASGHVNVVQIVVGPAASVAAPDQAVVDYIRSTFADRRPDLIVTVGGPAAVFARKYRQQLFPDRPLLLAAADLRYLREAPTGDNETAVATANDFAQIVDDILQLLPDTKQVLMLTGSGTNGEFWRRQLETELARFRGRLTFVWSNDEPVPDRVKQAASLPRDSAIFCLSFCTDRQCSAFADERVLADLHANANAPLFGLQSVMLGLGIVGGRLMSIDDLSRSAADAALRLLNGAAPRSVSVPPQLPGQPIFDWRELQRWGIDERRLPPGSVVRYRAPSLWQEYRRTVLFASGALVVQFLLIMGLLYERRARQRAEFESRRNLALAADASRRLTMSALTSSIAHELSQPLNAMVHNAEALQMMMTANRATPRTIREILSDIQAQSLHAGQIIDRHRSMLRSSQLEPKPVDVHGVVTESLALVGHDLRTRQIDVDLDLPPTPCFVSGDAVLLQQVLVNLVMNAMDAIIAARPIRRRIRIRAEARADAVAISVSDSGPGLPPEIGETLFQPFVTTKANGIGIGLTIARTIVHAHGGRIEARNHPEGGAMFIITLRRSEAEVLSTPAGAA